MLIGLCMVTLPAKAALVRKYLEVYWPCAGGLSAVDAIGTQLRDPIRVHTVYRHGPYEIEIERPSLPNPALSRMND